MYDGQVFSILSLKLEEQDAVNKQKMRSVIAMKHTLMGQTLQKITVLQDTVELDMARMLK